MISLKKFLEPGGELHEPLRRVVGLLLEGIRLHMPEADPAEFEAFRRGIQCAREALAAAVSADELLVHTGAAVKTLETYGQRTAKYFALRNREFQNILAMMTGTIREISAGSEENLRQLRDIERQVAKATEIEDVLVVRMRLAECLAQICRETRRQQTTTAAIVERLRDGVENNTLSANVPSRDSGQALPITSQDLDPVTGLPTRRQAELALEYIAQAEEPWYAAVMVIDTLPSINLRFGHRTGDEVLQGFGEFLVQILNPEDRLFRWSGPALLALLHRLEPLERVRDEFGRLMKGQRFEHSVRLASRTILLPVSPRWAILPAMAAPQLFMDRIDSFVTANVSQR